MNVVFYDNHVVMTKKTKTVNVNFRAQPEVRSAFKAVARLRGDDLSGMLNKYMVEEIRKEKERNLRTFEESLLLVQEEEQHEESQKRRKKGFLKNIDETSSQEDFKFESSEANKDKRKDGTNN